jgi:diguanylate cyclase (GGDEF)-like protein
VPLNIYVKTGRFDARLEKAYQVDLAQEKRRVYTRTYLLCSALYVMFGLLDRWALPQAFVQAWVIRALVIGVSALPCLLAIRRPDVFARHYTAITCATYVYWGWGIQAIILCASPGDIAWSAYYAGMILVSMALYTWTYLLPRYAAMAGCVIVVPYTVLSLTHQDMGATQESLLVLLTNLAFLLSANAVGLFSLHTRERFSRHNFLLRKQLRHDLRQEEQAKLHSEHRSEHDPLTGLPNRVRFMRKLDQLLQDARAPGSVAVLFLDLNDFKPVNDRFGHAVGDHVLRCVAQRLLGTIRATDLVARLGGDEFVVALALPQPCAVTIARVMAELHECIGQPIEHKGRTLQVSCSIGSACYPEDGGNAHELMEAADLAMYEFKRARDSGMAA